MTALLSIRDLVRRYRLPRTRLLGPPPELVAVDGVTLSIDPGRSLGEVLTLLVLGLLAGIERSDRAVIPHDAGPDFAALALGFRQLAGFHM